LKVLILHGLLHLAGHDHEADNGKMARRELQLRARLRLPLGLIERTTNARVRVPPVPRTWGPGKPRGSATATSGSARS
jgi:probable rRNA maturation factor